MDRGMELRRCGNYDYFINNLSEDNVKDRCIKLNYRHIWNDYVTAINTICNMSHSVDLLGGICD